MEYKICVTCGLKKELKFFRICGNYYRNDCYECEKAKNKIYRNKNKQKISEKYKEYRQSHLDYIKAKNKEYNELHKKERKEYNKKYYFENKEYYKEKHKKYVENNFEKIKTKNRQWKKNNIEKVKKHRQKDYEKRRNEPLLLLKDNIRKRIGETFREKNYKKNMKTENILGCKTDFFIDYLIKTYENNYNEKWDWNYLKNIHIDHIIPISKATTEEEIIKLNYYTNLQLLKEKDNFEKSDKLDWKL